MARHGILAVLAATVLSVGVNAGPCKPYSSAASSSVIAVETTATTQETVSSTITADITDTTDLLETTVTGLTAGSTESTDAFETTVTETATHTMGTTDAFESTITESASESSAETSTSSEPTTTADVGPAPCVETQILVNPSFDDNNDGSPWVLDNGVTVSQINPRSNPNFLYNTMTQARKTTTFSQSLPALGPYLYRLDYYFNLQTAINGRGFSCQVTPIIGGQTLSSSATLTDSGPYGFRLSSQYFTPQDQDESATLTISVQCQGSYNTIIVGVDDFSLLRTCGN